MSTIVTRAGKGSPLTHTEVDNNFTNLNTDKYQSGNNASFGTLSASGAFSANGGTTLGDASGDALTINSSAVSIPNGLNFGSNTLVLASSNVQIGTTNARTSRLSIEAEGTSTYAITTNTTAASGTRFHMVFREGGSERGSISSNGSANSFNISSTSGLGGVDANTVAINTNSSERMRITSAGNVGIGTTSPSTKLEVRISSDGSVATFRRDSGTVNPGLRIVANETGSTVGFDTVYSTSSPDYTFSIGGTQVMRLTSSGNLGLGVTPSAWGASTKSIDINTGGAIYGFASNSIGLVSNAFYNGTNWIYKNSSNLAALYTPTAGVHAWYNAPSGTAGNAITFTQAMTLDASGRLGIGTTSASSYEFNGTAPLVIANTSGNATFSIASSTTGIGYIAFADGTSGTSRYSGNIRYDHSADYMAFATNGGSDALRIDSSGNLLVGTTSQYATTGAIVIADKGLNHNIVSRRATSAAAGQIAFLNTNGKVGEIYTDGSATIYATSSDYRLKENIAPMTGALDKVSALKPVTYTWKVDGSAGEGFIAHELAELVPDCVTGEKDAVNEDGSIKAQGIDTSFLVATLTAAIQELKAEVDAQAARIAVLESK